MVLGGVIDTNSKLFVEIYPKVHFCGNGTMITQVNKPR